MLLYPILSRLSFSSSPTQICNRRCDYHTASQAIPLPRCRRKTDSVLPFTDTSEGQISPNPWKVVIFLYQLDLPFEMIVLDRTDPDVRKKDPVVTISPNGRMPIFEDPNTGVKLWESGAIIEYLLDVYDKENTLTYSTVPEKYEQNCWKHFQMSGQGPYYGQSTWFSFLHHEKLPSAQKRYEDEIHRVLGVIDGHLERTGRQWLVGDNMCFADLMFVPWNTLLSMVMFGPQFEVEWKEKFPKCYEWHQRLLQVESVMKAQEYAQEAAKSMGEYKKV
ncbi:glutathione S-transferase [Elsinoe ampelina]|uniref:Glutathione S-transferase n=1 Tax=Elsinoe ampelina TaxID=302913 RepID=A0A6A6G2R2_9PEZI|nr:glutathione S-transferase [Elsinoe ampelina]